MEIRFLWLKSAAETGLIFIIFLPEKILFIYSQWFFLYAKGVNPVIFLNTLEKYS